MDNYFDVIIIGAGPAGIGLGVQLKKLGINFTILEKNSVGSSFKKWPKETRFISPSFTGNFFSMPDLNAITPDTSPAYNLLTEHPSGKEYALYLKNVSDHHSLPIINKVNVKKIRKINGLFDLETNKQIFKSKHLVWAAGEYQYKKKKSFKGSNLCIHNSNIKSFKELKGEKFIVIGSYESGFDAALNLSKAGKKVTLLDSHNHLELVNSDSSYSLSPYTRDQIKNYGEKLDYYINARVREVKKKNEEYEVILESGQSFNTKQKPIDATGFDSSLKLVKEHFEFDGKHPLLTENDESTKTKNLYLSGPQVKHKNALFCFIYKFRQRFGIIAKKIAIDLNVEKEKIDELIQELKQYNFYLEDLSCCDNECEC
ncbi:MAG: NAD(P)/FAD-dependent oxidoreductase [Candidatus Woesearchaeota archaeon]